MEHYWEIAVQSGSYYPGLCIAMRGNDLGLGYDDSPEQGMVFSAFSYHVDEIHDESLAAARIFSLELLLNGALRIANGHVRNRRTEFCAFGRCSNGMRVNTHFESIDEYPFSKAELPTNDFSTIEAIQAHQPSYLIYLSKSDAFLRHLMFCVGTIATTTQIERIHTWATLYKIYDSVCTGCRELKLEIGDLSDAGELNRFTAACNNQSVLGLYARHGIKSNPPPASSMCRLDEAIQLIVTLASKYSGEHIKRKHAWKS